MTAKGRVGLILAVALLPHLPSLGGGFINDDVFYVQGNESVHTIGKALGLFARSYPVDDLYRPLMGLSYALDIALWGLRPLALHVTNVLLWALTGLVVDGLARRHLSSGRALAVTLLFLAHPAHCEVVDHITGRGDLLSALLLFLALYWEQSRLLSLVVFALACLAKESGAVLPGVILVLSLALRRERLGPLIDRLLPYGFVLLGLVALRWHVLGRFSTREFVLADPSFVEWTSTFGVVAWNYARILVWPVDLVTDRGYFVGVGVQHGPSVEALLGLLVVGVLIVWFLSDLLAAWWTDREAHVAFGIGVCLVVMAPYAHLVPFGALMGERFLHVSLLGFAWLIAVSGQAFQIRAPLNARAFVGFVVIAWCVRSGVRSAEWRDEVRIWTPIVARLPDDALSHYALGTALVKADRHAEAIPVLERARLLHPDSAVGRNMLGVALLHEGQPERARVEFEAALALGDDPAAALNGLGSIAGREGKLRTALGLYEAAVQAAPGMEQARLNLEDTRAVVARAEAARDIAEISMDPAALAVGREACRALEDARCVSRIEARLAGSGPDLQDPPSP